MTAGLDEAIAAAAAGGDVVGAVRPGELDELSLAFEHWMALEHVPANTARTRMRTLRSVGCAGTVGPEGLEAWWYARADLVSAATRANDLANLRTFYRWAARFGHRADDPTLRLSQPSVDAGTPHPMSRHDLDLLLDYCKRDAVLRRAIALGAYAGLRVAEAAAVMWPNVDLELRRIRVVSGKGNKSRLVPTSPLLVDELLPNTGGNVVTGTLQVYSADTLRRRVNRAIVAAGCAEGATFHWLRHRYGTLAYQATGDLLAVGRVMGHASPVTTAIYAEANDEVADRIAIAVSR